MVLLLVAAIILPLIVNRITPIPAVAALRPIFNKTLDNVGPYGADLKTVNTGTTPDIAVSGAPSTSLVIHRPNANSVSPWPLILWIHGGGWIAGNTGQISRYASILAARGFVVAELDYSLAPEARYPVPLRQAAAALAYLESHAASMDGDPKKVFLAGDSAGAQIASQVAAMVSDKSFAREVGVAMPIESSSLRGTVLACGPYDMATIGTTGFPGVQTFLWSYTGQRNYEKYSRIDELSTVNHVTGTYPATFLTVGDADPFVTQASEFAQALKAKNVPVTQVLWTGSGRKLGHEYQFDLSTQPARDALAAMTSFIQKEAA